MSFRQGLLAPNEVVVADLRPHWSYFSAPAVPLIAAIGAGVLVLLVGDARNTTPAVAALSLVLFFVFAVIWSTAWRWRWQTTSLVVTSACVSFRHGVLEKQRVDIPLDKIETLQYRISVVGRMIGVGEFVVESAGASGQQRFDRVQAPDRVVRTVQRLIAEKRRRHWTGA